MEKKTARKMTNADFNRAKARAGTWQKMRFYEAISRTVAKRLTDHILKNIEKR